MTSMNDLVVRSGSLSPSARALVCRILEVALEVVQTGTSGNWNRDSNSLEGISNSLVLPDMPRFKARTRAAQANLLASPGKRMNICGFC